MNINNYFNKSVNFRDLGGYEAADGRHIKSGLLYRSGGLYLMNPGELDFFKSLGIKSVMDLRTKEEADARPDPYLPEIDIVRHSGIAFANGEEIDFSPTGMSKIGKEGENQIRLIKEYYSSIPFNNEAFKILMNKIISNNAPILFHCHTGKDRTGVFAIILLKALGVDDETVFRDFMLSNEYHRESIEKAFFENAEKIKTHPEVKKLLTMWFGVSEDVGRSVISCINNKYGSPESYFEKEFGLDESGLSSLRNLYLA